MAKSTSDGEVSLVGGRSTVTRKGSTVFRRAAPWSKTTIALLRHLEAEGFAHAPRAIGSGFDVTGREMLTYVEGESPHPYPWDDDALPGLGAVLRKLHRATRSFVPPHDALWRPWFGRSLGQPTAIGHCDTGAWNIIAVNRKPIALIDWEEAGPVDPLIELAQACWLNALLFDDDLAEKLGLGSIESRARQVRLLLDGYELPQSQRIGFMAKVRDFAVLNAANEIIANPDQAEADPKSLLEALIWRSRSAAWLTRHHDTLDRIVTARV
ncbi:aminoglycoside phosphotransferase family protein [Devosia sp. MC532]|uniref:aminoglycoside phosphotransferase family protein n=1 Tax=Devosia sp. MC532 TaxID=2799788 RepID=UPI0018F51FAB|nr:aminoglycoside phosphotransferase family protein [Devosia sp. MC532]MBJ7578849.1 aminoglycoside phosphotransferase family protein [Devosia sp. MC532]